MTARNRVVREPYATWCGRTPVEIIHGLLPDCARHGHVLTGESPERGRQWQPHSQKQGVRREA